MSVEVVGRIMKDEEVIVVFLGSNFIDSNTEKMMVRSEGFDSWTFSYIHLKMSLPTKVCCGRKQPSRSTWLDGGQSSQTQIASSYHRIDIYIVDRADG
jgi:hypothetical protein